MWFLFSLDRSDPVLWGDRLRRLDQEDHGQGSGPRARRPVHGRQEPVHPLPAPAPAAARGPVRLRQEPRPLLHPVRPQLLKDAAAPSPARRPLQVSDCSLLGWRQFYGFSKISILKGSPMKQTLILRPRLAGKKLFCKPATNKYHELLLRRVVIRF